MRKVGSVAIVVVISFLVQSFLVGNTIAFEEDIVQEQSINMSFETSSMDLQSHAMTNVIRNPSMEEYSSPGQLEDWDVSASYYSGVNISAHSIVHGGTNSCLMYAMGSVFGSSSPNLIKNIQDDPLDDGFSIEFYYNLNSIPDIAIGSIVSFNVYTEDQGVNSVSLYYYLSYGSVSPTNDSESVYYLMNSTGNSWQHFSRNITDDFVKSPTLPALTPTRVVYMVMMNIQSPPLASGVTELFIDDFGFQYTTSPVTNNDFEEGYVDWSYTVPSTPPILNPNSEHTEGDISLNITCPTNSHAWISQYPTEAYYPHTGDCILEFDWKYSGSDVTVSGASDEASYLGIIAANASIYYYIYYTLGGNGLYPPYGNGTGQLGILSNNYGKEEQWIHERLDLYSLFSELGFTENYVIQELSIWVKGGRNDGSHAKLLLDNIGLWTYPLGNPGFEEYWLTGVPSLPTTSWSDYGHDESISLSESTHSGFYSLNLTQQTSGSTGVFRNVSFQVDNSLFTDFWWKLEDIQPDGTTSAWISLLLEGGFRLNYLVANGSSTMSNTSTSAWYAVESCNITGPWFNIARNITNDLNMVFNHQIWKLTSVEVGISTTSGRISILFDDMHFIEYSPPIIDSVSTSPSIPMCYDMVNLTVTTHDFGRIDEPVVKYSVGSSDTWDSLNPVFTPGGFMVTLPPTPYNEVVNISMIIPDSNGNAASLWYTYTPDDDLNPSITPLSDVTIEAWNEDASVTWSFVEHSPDTYQFISDGVIFDEGSYSGSSITISLASLGKGEFTCMLILTDLAGNSANDTIQITAVDTTPPQINSPVDIQYLVGITGSSIHWIVSEPDPEFYEIKRNDIVLTSGPWDGSNFTINVEGLSPGIYEYTLTLRDVSGNVATDTVIVTVTGTDIGLVILILSIIGIIGVTLVVIMFIKKR
ncbi:MAG: hypothetical protein ACFFF4_11730 [Candidatus Thorarchaeota archaeon]